jgi:hypothetical protein
VPNRRGRRRVDRKGRGMGLDEESTIEGREPAIGGSRGGGGKGAVERGSRGKTQIQEGKPLHRWRKIAKGSCLIASFSATERDLKRRGQCCLIFSDIDSDCPRREGGYRFRGNFQKFREGSSSI